jgi:folate-dependent phosphoribosylglycinamide formyltransferase PurN
VRAVLLSRYPRVDTLSWKQRVAAGLVDAGVDVAVLYSDASLGDQVRAGLRTEGFGAIRRYVRLRRGDAGERRPSLGDWARERGLTVERQRRLDDPETLRRLAPDVLVLVGSPIVPQALLAVPRLGTVNAHYGLLPAYRGMNVTEWSVLRGDPVGVSVHLVDEGIDTGAILLREEIPIGPSETFTSLRRKHQDVAAQLLVRACLQLQDGAARPQPQAAADGRQYYRMHPVLRQHAETRHAARAAAARP